MIRVISLVILIWFPGMENGVSQTAEMVEVKVPQEVRIYIGESDEISIDVTIQEGYHVQANPVNDDFLIPTAVEIKSVKEIIPGIPVYPPGQSFTLKGAPDTLLVYDGTFSIKLPIKVPPGISPETYTLEGELHYQACDSVRCFTPRSILFAFRVKVEKK